MKLNAEEIANYIKKQSEIASGLNQANVTGPCTENRACFKQTIRIGRSTKLLPYDELNPRKMCRACVCFWYADMARLCLENLRKLALMEEAGR